MKKLSAVINGIEVQKKIGFQDKMIMSIYMDSKKVQSSSLFIAIKGLDNDGHNYIAEAISRGSTAVVCEKIPQKTHPLVTYLQVQSSVTVCGYLFSAFYDFPSSKMKVVGVTGTNGKTTVASLLYQIFSAHGYNAGLISTIENRIKDTKLATSMTTPDPSTLQPLFHQMYQSNCTHVFMEVSSHAIAQERTIGINFDIGIFTNLSHDHLDFHGDFQSYVESKQKFFSSLSSRAYAIINQDDLHAASMVLHSKAKVIYYGLKNKNNQAFKVIKYGLNQTSLRLDNTEIESPIIGKHNMYNLYACWVTAKKLGLPNAALIQKIKECRLPKGRLQAICNTSQRYIFIDYAHTPIAVQETLKSIHTLKPKDSKLIAIMGCGGDRDKEKRKLMASIGYQWSDLLILTSDNPRNENPNEIIEQMYRGVEAKQHIDQIKKVPNRAEAIAMGIKHCRKQDILLVLGKGHEAYQEIGDKKIFFSDEHQIKEHLKDA